MQPKTFATSATAIEPDTFDPLPVGASMLAFPGGRRKRRQKGFTGRFDEPVRTKRYMKIAADAAVRALIRIVCALLLASASVLPAAAATPDPVDITWAPAAVGISTAPPFTFDRAELYTVFQAYTEAPHTAVENGFMQLTAFANDGIVTQVPTSGATGTPYSLWIQFFARGGSDSLPFISDRAFISYQLLGAPGVATFGESRDIAGFPAGDYNRNWVFLGEGTLFNPGTGSLAADQATGNRVYSEELITWFVPNPRYAGFFVDPPANTPLEMDAFLSTAGVAIQDAPPIPNAPDLAPRIFVNGGRGEATFAILVLPEPETYALFAAGLALLLMKGRRKPA